MAGKAYGVLKVNRHVYVNSSGHYTFEVVFNWRGRQRGGLYEPEHTTLVMNSRRRNRNKQTTLVNKYPKYLREDIAVAVYELLMSDNTQFYEYDQCDNRRYDNLRYHHDEPLNDCISFVLLDIKDKTCLTQHGLTNSRNANKKRSNLRCSMLPISSTGLPDTIASC